MINLFKSFLCNCSDVCDISSNDELADRILSPEYDKMKDVYLKMMQDGEFDLVLSFAAGGYDVVYPQLSSGKPSIFSRFAEKIQKADDEHKIKTMARECLTNPSRQHYADALQRLTNEFYHLYKVPMLTIKMSCCKMPTDSEISSIWRRNIFKVLNFLKLTETGIQGYVKDASDKPLHEAKIFVENDGTQLEYAVTKKLAHFRIVLPPGEVNIQIRCRGYATRMLRYVLSENKVLDLGNLTLESGDDRDYIVDWKNEDNGGNSVIKGKLKLLSIEEEMSSFFASLPPNNCQSTNLCSVFSEYCRSSFHYFRFCARLHEPSVETCKGLSQ